MKQYYKLVLNTPFLSAKFSYILRLDQLTKHRVRKEFSSDYEDQMEEGLFRHSLMCINLSDGMQVSLRGKTHWKLLNRDRAWDDSFYFNDIRFGYEHVDRIRKFYDCKLSDLLI